MYAVRLDRLDCQAVRIPCQLNGLLDKEFESKNRDLLISPQAWADYYYDSSDEIF